jgi:hypothetical protein
MPYLNPMPNNRQARHIRELAAKRPYNIYRIVKTYRVRAYSLTSTKWGNEYALTTYVSPNLEFAKTLPMNMRCRSIRRRLP